jgi:threonyl-tRNA synthetase
MFIIDEMGLKPSTLLFTVIVNCPAHCLLYASASRSYRELPIRYSEFSPLHRNEASGALSGLTRVRQFTQDDGYYYNLVIGHIFCRMDQIFNEISSNLKAIQWLYKAFGFDSVQYYLSTKPKDSIGSDSDWEYAQSLLIQCLNDSGTTWSIKEGDGAFYGDCFIF